jgi:hypothetical protein
MLLRLEHPSYCIVEEVAEQSGVCSVNCSSTLFCIYLFPAYLTSQLVILTSQNYFKIVNRELE